MFEQFKNKLYTSPTLKTAFSLGSSISIGFFSNTLVADMTTPHGIMWLTFYTSISFYLVLCLAALTLWFHKALHAFETDVLKFRDIEFCLAYARSRLLPEQIERSRQKIRDGDISDFQQAMKEIQKVLK